MRDVRDEVDGMRRCGSERKVRVCFFFLTVFTVETVLSCLPIPVLLTLSLTPLCFPFSRAPYRIPCVADAFDLERSFGAILTSVLVVSKEAFPFVEGSSDTVGVK